MLKTLKQLKGMLKMNFHFWVEGGNGRENILNALTSKNEIDAKFVQSHLSEIKQLIVNNKSWDFFSLNDLMRKYNLSNSDYLTLNEKFKVIRNVLWLPEWELKVQNYVTAIERVQKGTKSELSSVRTDVSNTRLPKTSWNIWYQDIVWKSKTKWIKLESQGSDIVSNFDENRDKWNKNLVRKLQRELWVKVDGIFWKNTRAALNAARWKSQELNFEGWFSDQARNEVVQSQFVWELEWTPLSWNTSFEESVKQVWKTRQEMVDLTLRFEQTEELNKMLKNYKEYEKRGYSIERWIRELLWDNKYKQVLKNRANYAETMSQPWARNKIERAVKELQIPKYINVSKDDPIGDLNPKFGDVVDFALKVAPWAFGIYVWDLPLPFVKTMIPGADVSKSVYFTQWLKQWMPWEFKDYYKQNVKELNPLGQEITLRWFLATTKLSSDAQAKILSWDLKWLDSDSQKLLLAYVKHNLLPNLKILNRASFNAAERWEWYTLWGLFGLFKDKKYDKIEKIRNTLEESVKQWKFVDIKSASEAFKLLAQEWDVDANLLQHWENANEYMNELWKQSGEVKKFSELSDNWAELYNSYRRVMQLRDLSDLRSLWASNHDVQALAEFEKIFQTKPLNVSALKSWEARNTWAANFIKALWDTKLLQKYQLNNIPKENNLEYKKVWNSKHGIDLSGFDNTEALRIAETTTPEKWGNISTLWYAYKTFVEKAGLVGISYEEFRNAFAKKQNISIDTLLGSGSVVNTWRKQWQWKLTSFEELKRKWDKWVFKMNINKTYDIYENGWVYKVTVDYDMYLRHNCTNPIITWKSIKITKDWQAVPPVDFISVSQVNGRLPIVIPWSLFKKPPKTPGKTPPPPTPPTPTPPTPTPPIPTPPPYIPYTPGLNTIPWNKETLLPKPGANGVIPRPWNFSPSAPDLIDRGTVVNPGQNIWNNLGWF